MDAPKPKGILKHDAKKSEHFHNKNIKKGRLIIRNLSFKVTEKKLTEIFGKFGNVQEVNIPTKLDGKKRGFGFVQFDKTQSAIRAINELNAKNILDRPVAVDFAVAKNFYEAKAPVPEPELEVVDDDFKVQGRKTSIDSDCDDDDEEGTGKDSDSAVNFDKNEEFNKEGSDDDSSMQRDDTDGSETEEKDDSDDSEGGEKDDDENSDEDSEAELPHKKPRSNLNRPSDAEDGRTLFIRNLSFQSHEEDLEEIMEPFGEIQYVLLCHDPTTGLPRGTGFVRFCNKEDALKCMDRSVDQLQGGLVLDGRQLTLSPALARDHAKKTTQLEEKTGKDKRNLYLAREGLVRQGTQAAREISKTDIALRTRLESRKKRALRNLHYFVSRTRLCIHNLPPGMDNRKLRTLFLRAADDRSAKIIEARVMKENNGYGKSKGFGFIEFTEHEHALTSLRFLNNNPDIFSAQRRPIVEFSIENLSALNAKLKRQERAKAAKDRIEHTSSKRMKKIPNIEKPDSQQIKKDVSQDTKGVKTSYVGFKSKKDIKTLPSHLGPKIRHRKPQKQQKLAKDGTSTNELTNRKESPKKKKRKRKGAKQMPDFQKEKIFQTLVNKYKTNLSSVSEMQKQKWYDGD